MTRKIISFIILLSFFYTAYSNECSDGSHLVSMGCGSFGKKTIRWWDNNSFLIMGKYCSMADVTFMLGGDHRTDWTTTYPFSVLWSQALHIPGHPKSKGNIYVGNDVWLGLHTLILSGVSIGDGAIICPGSVVTKNVPPYAIASGNPARVIKYRFDNPTIEKLIQIAWWDWPHEEIVKALPLMLSENIDGFIKYCESNSKL